MNKRKRINLLKTDIDDDDGEEIQEVSYYKIKHFTSKPLSKSFIDDHIWVLSLVICS